MGGGEQSGIPPPGTLLGGKYEVESVLGSGGMGVVLAARHVELGQRVALKFLSAQLAGNAEVVARFLREAQAAASVKSEHVARVLDVTRTAEGAPYIVMEHLAGTDLDQYLRARGPLPVDEAIDYLLQACEAIAEAHAAGIVHRDLKPGNLFLTWRADGSPLVKVLDFGISKVAATEGSGEQGSLTSPVAVLGSPWYMSPEQIRSSKNVDQRSDVWSLGVVLYKLLTATHPFQAETTAGGLLRIATEAPDPLQEKRPDLPAELIAVILRCLEKDVVRRLQNVAELAMALLPFAPERSRLSVERIVRVVHGSNVLTERTLPLSAVVAIPFSVPAEPATEKRSASAGVAWAPEVLSTGPSVSPVPPPTHRARPPMWLAVVCAVAAVAVAGALVVLGRRQQPALATVVPAPIAAPTAAPVEPSPSEPAPSEDPTEAAPRAPTAPATVPKPTHRPRPAASSTPRYPGL